MATTSRDLSRALNLQSEVMYLTLKTKMMRLLLVLKQQQKN